ncbi:MAG: ABC transporter ATP-binding protein [Eggerthellaceae bacterium]|nr:ABC transporter ATP-binding protein [Eggerthellaceae bacterium]
MSVQNQHEKIALTANDVGFSYIADQSVLESVSADIVPGSFLAILGVNGCGKSTLLSCLDGILRPKRGVILLNGSELSSFFREERAQHVAYVAQHSHANQLTVYDSLLLGRKPYVRLSASKEDYDKVDEVIALLSLESLALRFVDELSGGEYQKIIIARAFVQDPDVLLLDEPTNNLDMANQIEVLSLVREAVDRRGLAACAVMHDVNQALRFCDRFLMVKDGRVAAYGDKSIITSERILDVYGVEADIVEHGPYMLVVPK